MPRIFVRLIPAFWLEPDILNTGQRSAVCITLFDYHNIALGLFLGTQAYITMRDGIDLYFPFYPKW